MSSVPFIQGPIKGHLKGVEPRLKVTPCIPPITVEGPSDLRRARCGNCTRIFVEFEARRIERNPDIIEHPAYFALGIIKQAIMNDVMDRARLNCIDVPHKTEIVAIEAA